MKSFYTHIAREIKANVFDVIDYYSCNRKSFDGLTFAESFSKLFEECQFIGLDEDELSKAIDICLTLEQRRMHSYSSGNRNIADYRPSI